jgi:glucose dehydrogenase
MTRTKYAALSLIAAAGVAASPMAFAAQQPVDQWPTYAKADGSNYSPLTQITPSNVSRLQRAWTYNFGAGTHDEGDQGLDFRFEVQPLIIGGVMYISTPGAGRRNPDLKATVTALRPETGEVIWKYESPRNIHGRGLAYWPGDGQNGPRLYFGTDRGYLVALDMTTGKPAANFGTGGELDAYIGVVSERVGESRRATWTIPNPASVYKNLIITSARPAEAGPPGPRSDLRAWDAVTGKLVWTFHTIPQPGDAYNGTYSDNEWQDRSGANVWSNMTVDAERGILLAPLGDLNGRAKGSEFFSASLVALDANTGKLKWFQQITHKDIWDWDLPVPPVLATVRKDGKDIPAVIQAGKMGLVFMFNRETGQPIHGMEERMTPVSDDPLDLAWPTQPFPLKPGPIARVSMTRAEIPNITPEQYAYCTNFWDTNKIVNFGLYTRPMLNNGTVNFPAPTGGPNWGPPSFSPNPGLYVVNVQNQGSYRPAGPAGRGFGTGPAPGAAPAAPRPAAAPLAPGEIRQQGFQYRISAETVLPCAPTPWGELVAVDVHKGEIAWRVPLGDQPALGAKGDNLGARNLGGNIATASGLIFIGATNDQRFRAFETRTGRQLWEVDLPAGAHSTPVTYMGADGKQYVVTTAAGGTTAGNRRMSDALVAFRLP